jgi:hypothetical protein
MTPWVCSECSTKNRAAGRFCEQCGSARNPALSTPSAASTYIPPWHRPDFKPSRPEAPCDVEGCDQTVAQHIAECLELSSRIETKFTRPVVVNEHEAQIRRQAAMLRLGARS